MKKLKKVLGGAIAFAMLFSSTIFGGVKAEAKDVPKYLKNDTVFTSDAYMYGDKALTRCESDNSYYKKKIQNYCFDDSFYPERVSKKYVYATDYKKHILFNIETGEQKDAFPMIEKINKAIIDKYKLNSDHVYAIKFEESDTDVFWSRFMFGVNDKSISGLVSSNGDIIEFPGGEKYNYQVTMHNNKAYILYDENGKYDLKVYSVSGKESDLCTIAKDNEKEDLLGLVFNKDDNMYIMRKSERESKQGEINKINVRDGKGTLTTIAKYDFDIEAHAIKNVAVDNNKNIWYLQDGLVYKIENDKPVLKYEVQKSNTNLFVSDDNNLIVSGGKDEKFSNNGHSTIINLSDKYTNGWSKENNTWYYYVDRQCVNNEWKQIDGKWYCFDSDGKMVTGWQNDEGNNWYYLNDNGSMATGWRMVDGKWYFLKSNGQATKGWNFIDGKWYYFNFDINMYKDYCSMETGWKQIDGAWYYFYDNGSMACNTTIDGYKIGNSGAMI